MAATIARIIEEFSPSVESWIEYEERFEFSLVAHNITEDEKKKAHLVPSTGASKFSLLRSSATSQGIKEKPYVDFVRILRQHFSPKPSEVGQ